MRRKGHLLQGSRPRFPKSRPLGVAPYRPDSAPVQGGRNKVPSSTVDGPKFYAQVAGHAVVCRDVSFRRS